MFASESLPRGGLLISSPELTLQVGCYPETIKDTMTTRSGVPQVFVAPEVLFDFESGVSAMEAEFPVYFNFYLRQRKTTILCRESQVKPLARVLREAVFGPSALNLGREFGEDSIPDLYKEMRHFKRKDDGGYLRLRELVDIIPLKLDSPHQLAEGVQLKLMPSDEVQLRVGDKPWQRFWYRPRGLQAAAASPAARFEPPVFGITVIGSGHGFDSSANTSGFVIWLNGRGVLVDPPVNTTEWLASNGVDARLVEEVILTHCHADHDAGTLQMCMQEGRVRLVTTPTVLESFVRKYRGLLGLSGDELRILFDFEPVHFGESLNIAGGKFDFHYTFHPVPTLGFEMEFLGKKFAYSCDTLYHPETIRKLEDEGLFPGFRANQLCHFPSDADIIFHEAGIPPIHTPMETLAALEPEVRDKLWLTHVSADQISPDSGLRLAPPGVENSLRFDDLLPLELGLAQRMLDLLRRVELFRGVGIDQASEFLRIVQYRKVDAGDFVLKTGDPGDEFYLVLSGEAEVLRHGERINVLGRFDYFGEMAMILRSRRTADIRALTDMELLILERQDFVRFFRGTDLIDTLTRVTQNRMHGSWPLIHDNSFLGRLSTYQKTQLVAAMEHRRYEDGEILFEPDQMADRLWLVDKGKIHIAGYNLGRGTLVGAYTPDVPFCYQARTAGFTELYAFPAPKLARFFQSNPGTYVRYLTHHRTSMVPWLGRPADPSGP